jgi:hypothetical protein
MIAKPFQPMHGPSLGNSSLDKFNYLCVKLRDTHETLLSVVILHINGVNVTSVSECPIKLHGTNIQWVCDGIYT